MKSILYVFAGLLFINLACTHTSVKQQNEKKMNTGNKEQSSMNAGPNLDDYTGDWKIEKKAHGCSPIKIEKGPEKDTIQITRKSAVYTVSKDSSFDSPTENTIADYHEYKLSTSTTAKFIRGKIVSAHIWAPNTNAWLGVGLPHGPLRTGFWLKERPD